MERGNPYVPALKAVVESRAALMAASPEGTRVDLHKGMDMIWESHQHGVYCPPAMKRKLTMDEAYRVQLGFLGRRLKAGERQAGWKVGLTAESLRKQVGYHEPIFSVLLASGHKPSGSTFKVSELIAPCFESELCLTVGQTLIGPTVTVAEARTAAVFTSSMAIMVSSLPPHI